MGADRPQGRAVSIKILDAGDINAFSTLGGFIYINEGTLDFAQSDDELAG